MTTTRRVSFTGVDWECEDAKTEASGRRRSLQKEEKRTRKVELQKDREEVKYFLMYLQTCPLDERHEQIKASCLMPMLFRFPGETPEENREDDDEEQVLLERFDEMVATLKPTWENKEAISSQKYALLAAIRIYSDRGYYGELDRFSQFLRLADQRNTLEGILESLSDQQQAVTRAHVEQLQAWSDGEGVDNETEPMDKAELGSVMIALQDKGTYDSGILAPSPPCSPEELEEMRTFIL